MSNVTLFKFLCVFCIVRVVLTGSSCACHLKKYTCENIFFTWKIINQFRIKYTKEKESFIWIGAEIENADADTQMTTVKYCVHATIYKHSWLTAVYCEHKKSKLVFRTTYNFCLYRKKKMTSRGHRFKTFNFREKQTLNKIKSYPNFIQILFYLFFKRSIDKIKDKMLKLLAEVCTTFVACCWATEQIQKSS